jgi:hypothetical protein
MKLQRERGRQKNLLFGGFNKCSSSFFFLLCCPHQGDGVGYTEAGPWQYRLEVPYAPLDLQALLADEMGIEASQVVEDANSMVSEREKWCR